ncbi:PAS domain-containing protein [Massilia solisilvae]|uniref:histidine kinase n=1 Tax=Massilia solisilvae TaxID=1811225 RepID=A0ABT2BG09_9BURK|nr:ATP-binding protein [Massilia solisilvae]MCS0607357.1 PAS domain-containing protein [Massilia solisilvae]
MTCSPDYAALFRASPYPHLLLDPGLRIVAANPAYLQVTGTHEGDIVGLPIFDAFPPNPDDPESTNVAEVRASLERVIATGKPDNAVFVRYSIPQRDGHDTRFKERYWSTVHTPVFDDAGRLAYISQNALDVTEFYRYDRRRRTALPAAGDAPDASGDAVEQARRHAAMQRAVIGERSYLRNLFNQAPGFIAVLNGPEHVFEIVNEAYYQLVGHRPIIGRPLSEALPEVRGQRFPQLLDSVYESGKPFVGRGMKAHLQREPDGALAEAYVDLLYQPLFDQDGKVNGIFVQGHDVTEAHAAQLAKRESEERLADGMLAARMVVWDWNVATREVIFSDNAEHVLGARGGTMAEMHAHLPPQDRERLQAAHAGALAARGSYAETVRYVRPDTGRLLWLDVRGKVRCGADGNPESVRGVAIDVTERVRAEEDLRDAHRRKDEFLAMLAHELRNPLAPIAAAAQLLRHGPPDPARQAQAADIITRQVRHVAGLLDDLIDVSRVTRGLVAMERAPVDMHAVAADALEQARPAAERRGQTLAVRLPDAPARIAGDHKRIVQVLSNLLGNACKYTPEGGRLQLDMALGDGKVMLRVADDGIGIGPELLPHVFDLFTQGERSADRAQGGLGVGLAVVRSLVEQHGGQVRADSDGPGKGSTFTVVLPLLDGGMQAAMPAPAAPAAAPGLRVLVVDDNPDAARMLAMVLESEGHEVAVENSSAAALRRVATDVPDVCLLDIGLPGMDGYELARRLRALPALAASRLVAVTGYGQPSDRALALQAGFDHHLVKPVDLAELFGLLRSVAKG